MREIKFDKADRALIGAYDDREQSEGSEQVLATRFIVDLAVPAVNDRGKNIVQLVDLAQTELKLAPLQGTDSRTEQLAKTFKYEIIEGTRAGVYQFQPLIQIPEMGAPYYMVLPISCSYGGVDYALDLAVRLLGEPFNEMAAKQEELRLLLARVRRYLPPDEWYIITQEFKEQFDKMSVSEIRLMNRSICDVAQSKLLRQSAELQSFSDTLDWVIGGSEWTKWIGDQAFSILMTMWTGPVGEIIIVPAKDIMVMFLAEYASQVWLVNKSLHSQAEMTSGIRSGLAGMLENLLMEQIDTKKLDMKKLGAVLATFAVLKTIDHNFNDLGPDGEPIGLLDAMLATFSDLTSTTFKLAFQQKFEQYVDSDDAKALFGKYATPWVTKFLDANLSDWQTMGIVVIQKYVIELCGEGVAWAYDEVSSKAGQTVIKQNADDIVMTFTLYEYAPEENKAPIMLDINLSQVKDRLIDYVFDILFAFFPFPAAPVQPPVDPHYTPAV